MTNSSTLDLAPEPFASSEWILQPSQLQQMLDALTLRGYQVVGPTLRDGAIIYDEIASVSDLPVGWTDEQEAGQYRLRQREDGALFGYTVGPHSWKKFLFPPVTRLWHAEQADSVFRILHETPETPHYAFLGVRPCELHAIAIQDRVFLEGEHVDPTYQQRREDLFLIAVQCGQAGGACFCLSMETGPRATAGFDLALTEVLEEAQHYFVVEAGTERGLEVLRETTVQPASAEETQAAQEVSARTAAQMGRSMDTTQIQALLYRNYEHPRWDEVANRCLSCANCTLVCPTCFCSTVEDTTDVTGEHAERWRKWDSCFTLDHSYLHGGSVRTSTKSRYRQWMTHKLATWIDQFGSSGCVGCGRCIVWCPVGIDLTEEVAAIRATEPGILEPEETS